MSLLMVPGFSVSLHGFGAGPFQALASPLGEGGKSLTTWFFATRNFSR
jgi:hypothetical protein